MDLDARVRRALTIALLALIGCLDAATALIAPPVGAELALLDEPAHLATAVLVLLNLRIRERTFLLSALVASVVIDLDHLPRQLGSDFLTHGTTRPYTHSLAGVAGLSALALLVTRRRAIAIGVATGLLAHLARDVATGGGVALLWPLTGRPVQIPRAVYFATLVALATRAVARPSGWTNVRSPRTAQL
jgi:inner membrane protein